MPLIVFILFFCRYNKKVYLCEKQTSIRPLWHMVACIPVSHSSPSEGAGKVFSYAYGNTSFMV